MQQSTFDNISQRSGWWRVTIVRWSDMAKVHVKCLEKYELLLHLSRSFQALVLCLVSLLWEHESMTGKKYWEVQVAMLTISLDILDSIRGHFVDKYASSLYGEACLCQSHHVILNLMWLWVVNISELNIFLLQLHGCPIWSWSLDLFYKVLSAGLPFFQNQYLYLVWQIAGKCTF